MCSGEGEGWFRVSPTCEVRSLELLLTISQISMEGECRGARMYREHLVGVARDTVDTAVLTKDAPLPLVTLEAQITKPAHLGGEVGGRGGGREAMG